MRLLESKMFYIKIESDKYPGELTVLDEYGNRVAFKDGAHGDDIRWKLKNHFPHHIFESERLAIAAQESARNLISDGGYAEKIKRSFYFRFGDDAPEKIAKYIDRLLARLDNSEIVHIDNAGS